MSMEALSTWGSDHNVNKPNSIVFDSTRYQWNFADSYDIFLVNSGRELLFWVAQKE